MIVAVRRDTLLGLTRELTTVKLIGQSSAPVAVFDL